MTKTLSVLSLRGAHAIYLDDELAYCGSARLDNALLESLGFRLRKIDFIPPLCPPEIWSWKPPESLAAIESQIDEWKAIARAEEMSRLHRRLGELEEEDRQYRERVRERKAALPPVIEREKDANDR